MMDILERLKNFFVDPNDTYGCETIDKAANEIKRLRLKHHKIGASMMVPMSEFCESPDWGEHMRISMAHNLARTLLRGEFISFEQEDMPDGGYILDARLTVVDND